MKLAGVVAILAMSLGAASLAHAQSVGTMAAGVAPVLLAQSGTGTIECKSVGMQPASCRVPWRDAVLVRQTSKSACVRGSSWGYSRGAVWVDRGCAGVFADANHPGAQPYPPGNGGWQPGPGWDRSITLRCGSPQYRYNFCQVDTGRGSRVHIRRQLSDTRCVEGRNWGWNRGGIWVDQGCSGEFVVERRWR
ncbi:DUF3011 domain-containing protein [Dokdonella sp.]|uniref:DUF3011 domain-containing protein n=1 Tax=Dokdonella sp. TaxID=2291710 RepID=UPI0031C2C73A|nr:DUF3011 domain-containing protein [Dokdonella sp.]